MMRTVKDKFRPAFTIVELIVVISVIAILAGIVIVSYGAWRTSTATNSLKSDLGHAASAMESSRTFNNTYGLTLPSTFTASQNNTITLTLPAAKSYCIDGTTSTSSSIKYYIDNVIQSSGPVAGTCATRVSTVVPGAVSNVTFTTGTTQIVVNWSLAVPNYATQYIAQCSVDSAFINGLIQGTASGSTTVQTALPGANPDTTYYCRVRAVNANGQSEWSTPGSGNTQQRICADTNQYGSYPDCYNFDSFPVGTSISGYWSTAPDQYLLEDGSAVSRTKYADLFALIGTTYGAGDGTSTFNLPDSRGRVTVNRSPIDPEFDTVGEKYGEKAHKITINETPSHSHPQNVTANSGPSTRRDFSGDVASGSYAQGVNTDSTGGNAASNVVQPSIVRQYAIKWRVSSGPNSSYPTGATLQGYWTSQPTNFATETGGAVSRAAYSVLYGKIGTTYGTGDGSTTFNLPNSQGRVGVNRNPSDTQFATLGQAFGEKTHLLTIGEMVSHTHTQIITANSGGSALRNDFESDGGGGVYPQGTNTSNAGGGQAFNVIQPSIVKLSTIKTAAPDATLNDTGIVTGTSIEGWWSSAPTGYLAEDGSAVSRTTYSDLFAVIGTTYGAGNGSTTFNLPDSRGRVAVNRSPSDSQFANIGQKSGEKTHIMTISELASHSHAQYVTAQTSGGTAIRADYKADAAGGVYAQGVGTGPTGGGAAYNVIQPSITKMFAIKY